MTAAPLALSSERAPRDERPEDIDLHQTSTIALARQDRWVERRVWIVFVSRLVVAGLLICGALALLFGGGR